MPYSIHSKVQPRDAQVGSIDAGQRSLHDAYAFIQTAMRMLKQVMSLSTCVADFQHLTGWANAEFAT